MAYLLRRARPEDLRDMLESEIGTVSGYIAGGEPAPERVIAIMLNTLDVLLAKIAEDDGVSFAVERQIHTLRRFELCDNKSLDYASGQDRLANFKRIGARLRQTPETILMVYATKHYDAICAYIEGGCEDDRSEPIVGRIYDLQNYMDLLLALGRERREGVLDGTDSNREKMGGECELADVDARR
jgi:hypothetical protein